MVDQPKKVFIIDDDQFLLNMYSIKFSKSGFEVVTSTGAMDALNKIRDGLVPDIVILDIVMPAMDGFELLRIVRKENLLADAAVIVLSNQGQQADINKAKELGITGYIVKASTIPSEVLKLVVDMYEKRKKA